MKQIFLEKKNITTRLLYQLSGLLLMIVFLASCNGNQASKNGKVEPRSHAFGALNKLCVIADQDVWDGAIGDSIRYTFAAAYPILPQPEPIFDLVHFTPEELQADKYRKELRAYLIVGDLNDTNSGTTRSIADDLGEEIMQKAKNESNLNIKVGQNKWAKGQILVFVFANGKEALVKAMQKNASAIMHKYNEFATKQLDAHAFFGGENKNIQDTILEKFNLHMRIPSEYFIAVNNENTLWLRKETEFLSSNLMMYKLPYQNKKQLTKSYIKSIRDTLGKNYVTTEIKNTYMRINDVDLPMISKKAKLDSMYSIESRGIWEIVNDYMGGSFISYLILNEKQQELIYIDGFVHAPGKKKRDFMMHLEYIINTIRR